MATETTTQLERAEDQKMADGIVNVRGTLYEIEYATIYVAPKGKTGANLRYLSGDESSLGVGFEKVNMDRLYQSIRDSGMHNLLICRWILQDGVLTVQLVDGERRWRTLDRLMAKNEKCYDPATKKMVPAKELYGIVLCRVYDAATDKEAMKLSYQENRSRVSFSEKVDIGLVADLREKEFSDEEILDITGQKPDWLRDTDRLIVAMKDDPETMSALANGIITRDAALIFSEIEDIAERRESVKAACDIASKQYAKKVEKIDKTINRAKSQREQAAADVVDAKHRGDAEGGKAAASKASAASKRIEEKAREKSSTKPEVTARTATKVTTKKIGAPRANDGVPRALSAKKIGVMFIDPMEALIKAHGKNEEDETICPTEAVKFAHSMVKAVRDGDEDACMRIVRRFGKIFMEGGFKSKKNDGE